MVELHGTLVVVSDSPTPEVLRLDTDDKITYDKAGDTLNLELAGSTRFGLSDGLLDMSGATGDATFKFSGGNALIISDGTNEVLVVADGIVTLTGMASDDRAFVFAANNEIVYDQTGTKEIRIHVDDGTTALTLAKVGITLELGATVNEFDTSVALDGGNVKVPTSLAVKTYVDAQVSTEDTWNFAANVLTPATSTVHTLDLSGAAGNMTLKTKGNLILNKDGDVIHTFGDGYIESQTSPATNKYWQVSAGAWLNYDSSAGADGQWQFYLDSEILMTVDDNGVMMEAGVFISKFSNDALSSSIQSVPTEGAVKSYVDAIGAPAHIADLTLHFTEASISHLNIGDIGTNSHAAIDTHIADGTLHFALDTDVNLAGGNTVAPSALAVKTYVDAAGGGEWSEAANVLTPVTSTVDTLDLSGAAGNVTLKIKASGSFRLERNAVEIFLFRDGGLEMQNATPDDRYWQTGAAAWMNWNESDEKWDLYVDNSIAFSCDADGIQVFEAGVRIEAFENGALTATSQRVPTSAAVKTYVDAVADKTATGTDISATANYGVKINTSGAKVAAAVGVRGQIFIEYGGAGVRDKVYKCLKSDSDTYSWVLVTDGGA